MFYNNDNYVKLPFLQLNLTPMTRIQVKYAIEALNPPRNIKPQNGGKPPQPPQLPPPPKTHPLQTSPETPTLSAMSFNNLINAWDLFDEMPERTS